MVIAEAGVTAATRATIERLYAALARMDGETMQACYSADAKFEDEVFRLQGARQIGGMWRMLCDNVREHGQDVWRVEASAIQAQGGTGSAHWEAHYRFSATGRLVHNVIDAEFAFDATGLIRRHRDRFDFAAWSRQALGLPGLLFGRTSFLRRKVRRQAMANLQKYQKRHR